MEMGKLLDSWLHVWFLAPSCGQTRERASEGVSLVLTMRQAYAGTSLSPAFLSILRPHWITKQLGKNKAEVGSHVTTEKPMQVVQSNLHHKSGVNAFHNSTWKSFNRLLFI